MQIRAQLEIRIQSVINQPQIFSQLIISSFKAHNSKNYIVIIEEILEFLGEITKDDNTKQLDGIKL